MCIEWLDEIRRNSFQSVSSAYHLARLLSQMCAVCEHNQHLTNGINSFTPSCDILENQYKLKTDLIAIIKALFRRDRLKYQFYFLIITIKSYDDNHTKHLNLGPVGSRPIFS